LSRLLIPRLATWAVVVLTLLAAPASAEPAQSWTGAYIGGDIGLRASQADWTTQATFFGPPDPPEKDYNSAAARFGAFFGYNWQFAPRWVGGVEADIGWANTQTKQPGWLPGISGGLPPFPPIINGDESTIKTTWDSSLRLRLGYLMTPGTLIYGTGGIAWQRLEWNVVCAVCGGLSASDETTRAGWTIGAGTEMRLSGHWLLRGEYRYADFGTVRQTMTLGGLPTALFDIKLATHTFKFGLAYQFGEHAAPEAAWKAERPPSDWGGAYIGSGLGMMASQTRWSGIELAGIPASSTGDGSPQRFNDTAFRGSLIGGYNWTIATNYVAGIEADIGYTGNTASQPGYAPGFYGVAIIAPGDTTKVRTTWDASVRGRFGYLFMPHTLVYATAGVAFQRYTFTSSFVCGCGGEQRAETSKTYVGGTIGGGVETQIWGQWRARVEYRYTDFGTQRVSMQHPIFAPNPFISDMRLTTHTAQFVLIYDLN
jgi:outer membrane immunogenic protein